MTTTTLFPVEKLNKVTRNKRHQYQHEDYPGELWPGVTTALGVIAKPALIPWARNVALEDAKNALLAWLSLSPHPTARIDREGIEVIIEQARKRPDEVRDEAADFGTRSHEMIAAWLRNEDFIIPDALTPVLDAFTKWYAGAGLKIQMAETIVYSERHKFGGTVDAIAERDGQLVVVDWKTGNYSEKMKTGIYNEMAVQVGGYALALEEMTGQEVKEAWVVRFGKKEPEFEAKQVINLNHAKRGFINALNLHHSLKEKLI